MLGLKRSKEELSELIVLFIAAVEGSTPGFYEMAFPIAKAAIQEMEEFAKEVGGHVELRYLNYCDGSQDPLGSYGEENIHKTKDVATKYDPTGVSQGRVPGGFKLSKVNSPVQ
ncbi:FAD binding domain-containing protein [Seiridium cupressi]